jgi:hypothetical protein
MGAVRVNLNPPHLKSSQVTQPAIGILNLVQPEGGSGADRRPFAGGGLLE